MLEREKRKSSQPAAVCLSKVPFFHIYGFALCLRTVAFGETLVSMDRIELKKMLKAIQEHRVRHVAAAPPLVISLINEDRKVVIGYDLSSLEVVACGGAPLGRDAAALFTKLFPSALLVQAYGLTETTGRMFTMVGSTESKVGGAMGKLCPSCEAKIVDPETGISLLPGKAGELWVRGPTIMKGYVGDEEATAKALDSEGWLRTGDLCYIDDQGFLFVVDRIKELIKCRGYQVKQYRFCRNSSIGFLRVDIMGVIIESGHIQKFSRQQSSCKKSIRALISLASVNKNISRILKIFKFPDEKAGQVPVAFMARQNGSTMSESQIKDFVANQVAPYKRIRRVMFIPSLPKSAQGKILRKDLTKKLVMMSTAKL